MKAIADMRMPPTLSRTDFRAAFSMGVVLLVGAFAQAILLAGSAAAQEFSPGSYLWYVPDHEKYGRTTFYSQPNFTSGTVRVTRAQRFKMLDTRRGWAAIEFDYAGRAYVHIRILRTALYAAGATDPHYEFQRASVFTEEPKVIAARLQGLSTPAPQVVDSKVPAWKRYKDGWNLKPSRQAQTGPDVGQNPGSTPTPSALPDRKPRSKYSPLPPIGSEPAETTDPAQPIP